MRRLFGYGLAFVVALATAQVAAAVDSSADWSTTAKVKLELLSKLGVDALRVDVDTIDGNVALAGTVEKRETRELAGDIAKSIGGVRRVDNNLRVEAAIRAAAKDPAGAAATEAELEVKDGILEARLRLALVDKLGTDGFRIGTEAANGVVTLEFPRELMSARRAEAERVARSLEGVVKVVSVDKRG